MRRSVKLITHLHLLQRSRKVALYFYSPIRLHTTIRKNRSTFSFSLFSIFACLSAHSVVIYSSFLYCGYIRYKLCPNWPSSRVQVSLTRKLLLLRVLPMLVQCCSHACTQLYGFVGRIFPFFVRVAVLDVFVSCFRCNLLGVWPPCLPSHIAQNATIYFNVNMLLCFMCRFGINRQLIDFVVLGTGGELLWIRYWTFGFHEMLGNYRVA
jgi:hypothetical protein